jgi:hypothetical protein
VAHDAHAGIDGQHPFQPRGRFRRAVGDDDLAGVEAVADAHAAAVVVADPGRAADGVDQRVEDGPVGDGVGAVAHALRLAVGAGHRPGVQMVAADDDGRFDGPAGHQFVEQQPGLGPLAVAQPADAGRQALEMHLLLGHANPAVQVARHREQLQDGLVGGVDVFRVAAEGHPAERPLALAKERPDIGRHEAGVAERVSTPSSKARWRRLLP